MHEQSTEQGKMAEKVKDADLRIKDLRESLINVKDLAVVLMENALIEHSLDS